MVLRPYDPDRDRLATRRIWHEVGWLSKGMEEDLDRFLGRTRTLVAEVDGAAECVVATTPAEMLHQQRGIEGACVACVTTSHVARRRGLAQRLTAAAVAHDAAGGARLALLGMFEQGFYNRVGFGTGAYVRSIAFDPAHLRVPVPSRSPRRVTRDDWEMVHAARLRRLRRHGGVNLTLSETTRMEMRYDENAFGLGFRDGPGDALSHLVWVLPKQMDHGPYHLELFFQTREQLLELLGVLRTLGDQVRLVSFREPPGIQLQDLLAQPFKHRQVTDEGKFAARMRCDAYWQARICDVPACMAATHLHGNPVRFHLRLEDPIAEHLDPGEAWRGCGGDWMVTLGPESSAEPAAHASLPMLEATVGAFTRLWLGVQPATGLAATDHLRGPEGLLEALDRALGLPQPQPDWEF